MLFFRILWIAFVIVLIPLNGADDENSSSALALIVVFIFILIGIGYIAFIEQLGKLKNEVRQKDQIISNLYKERDKEGVYFKDGVVKDYYRNGKLRCAIPYKNGTVHGTLKEYNEHGLLRVEIHMKMVSQKRLGSIDRELKRLKNG